MSVDDSVGGCEPYMKDKKYSFPVLIATDLISMGVTPAVGSSAGTGSWDRDGKWEWKEDGFAARGGVGEGNVGEIGREEG